MKKRYQPPNLEYNNNDNSFVNEGVKKKNY